jgi:hypothetical protein
MMETVKKRFAKRVSATKLAAKKLLTPRKKISDEEFNQRVQSRAYDVYLQNGCIPGRDQENWLEAERLVKAELGI